MRNSLPLFLIAAFSLLTDGCSKGITRATAVTIFSVNGTITFGPAERNHFQQVTMKSRISEGDVVRSSDGASVDFALLPTALATLFGNSEINIEQLTITKDGNETTDGLRERVARIRLNRGKIAVLFSPSNRPSAVAIVTQAVIVVPNSDCLFSVDTDGPTTRVTCAKGDVQTSAAMQRSLAIGAGYFHQWPGSAATLLPAADHAAAQIDITQSLHAGERLINYAAAGQDRRRL